MPKRYLNLNLREAQSSVTKLKSSKQNWPHVAFLMNTI